VGTTVITLGREIEFHPISKAPHARCEIREINRKRLSTCGLTAYI